MNTCELIIAFLIIVTIFTTTYRLLHNIKEYRKLDKILLYIKQGSKKHKIKNKFRECLKILEEVS